MNFTYTAYEKMLSLLKENNYEICNYENHQRSNCCVILRHDVDLSLEKALRFAELEFNKGVQSTYFILLSTSFYNLFHRKSNDIIKKIRSMGHEIGLHFDEVNYPIGNIEETAIDVVDAIANPTYPHILTRIKLNTILIPIAITELTMGVLLFCSAKNTLAPK
jgi:hypothetical protein